MKSKWKKHRRSALPVVVTADGSRIRLRTERAMEVAKLFGLNQEVRRRTKRKEPPPTPSSPELELQAGTITLVTGPSGSGKSTLLRRICAMRASSHRFIDLATIDLPDLPLVDCFGEEALEDVLKILGRVGLGEAWSYLRTPGELSEGQRSRLKMAMGLSAAKTPFGSEPQGRRQATAEMIPVIVCDEFAAVLDRVTAMVVARCLRRTIGDCPEIAVLVATSHDDLAAALQPEVTVHCDFGRTSVATHSVKCASVKIMPARGEQDERAGR